MSDGGAVLLILSVHAAWQEVGWGALLGGWHASLTAVAIGQPVDSTEVPIGPPDPPLGAFEEAAAARWRAHCVAVGADPDDPHAAVAVLEGLGLVERRRALVRKRWALVEPAPPADRHPDLDVETRAAAVEGRRRFATGMAVGELLERGDGRHPAASVEALAADARVDAALLRELAAEPGCGWRIVDDGAGVVLEEVPDPERDDALAAIDALPDDAFGPGT